MLTRIDKTDESIVKLMKKLNEHIEENEREQIDECRRRILVFNDKVICETNTITKERYDSILEDIDRYEKYCQEHVDYPNSKAVLSIHNLKKDYSERYSAHLEER